MIILNLLFACMALLLITVQFDVFRARLPSFHQFFGNWQNWLVMAIVACSKRTRLRTLLAKISIAIEMNKTSVEARFKKPSIVIPDIYPLAVVPERLVKQVPDPSPQEKPAESKSPETKPVEPKPIQQSEAAPRKKPILVLPPKRQSMMIEPDAPKKEETASKENNKQNPAPSDTPDSPPASPKIEETPSKENTDQPPPPPPTDPLTPPPPPPLAVKEIQVPTDPLIPPPPPPGTFEAPSKLPTSTNSFDRDQFLRFHFTLQQRWTQEKKSRN